VAVDIWENYDELKTINFNKVYENFKYNLNLGGRNENVNFLKTNSDDFFKNNKNHYNLIYIDGLHHYEQVKKDFINSFNFLESNGYIICDDFTWTGNGIHNSPAKAIIECYELYKRSLKIEYLTHQIIFRKI
jgi:predicted O-methyltransferase YrrM